MDNATNSIFGLLATLDAGLIAAVSHLYRENKRLNEALQKAPRPEDHAKIIDDCDKLKAIVDGAAAEARRSLAERDAENRKLEAKVIRLESAVARIGKRDG